MRNTLTAPEQLVLDTITRIGGAVDLYELQYQTGLAAHHLASALTRLHQLGHIAPARWYTAVAHGRVLKQLDTRKAQPRSGRLAHVRDSDSTADGNRSREGGAVATGATP